jgi:2-polyprenyl-3-methyl-5-hydroxy-6-metoxy-1,4-benzoquinol methylase
MTMAVADPQARNLDPEEKPMAVYGAWAQRMLAEARGVSMKAEEPEVLSGLQGRLDELLGHLSPVHMLDAGCGKNRAVPVATECYIVGVDISESQLANNSAIDEAIVGDIQTCELGKARFDAVFCWDVLEHVERPEQALLNFKSALKPGGVMIIAVPHVSSIKGLVTRFTPFWFHGWVWHRLLGLEPEIEPFPTVMSPAIAPQRLRRFAQENDLTVEFLSEYEGWKQKKLRSDLRLTGRVFQATQALVKGLSLGRVTIKVTDAIVVMRSRAPLGG